MYLLLIPVGIVVLALAAGCIAIRRGALDLSDWMDSLEP